MSRPHTLPLRAALGLLTLALAVALPVRAEPASQENATARQLIVALVPAAAGGTATAAVTGLERYGLSARETLADRLARAGVLLAGTAATGPGASGVPGAPFDFDPARIWLVEAADSLSAAAALESLRADPAVAWAEPNRERSLDAVVLDVPLPDDPLLRDGRQWGLRNLGPAGPYGGVAGADIGALAAWSRTTGSNDLLLAVADTGIDPAQPDLGGTLPDGSPRIVFGTNVSGLEPAGMFTDSNGHGTPVAGVIAARTNDGAHFDSLGVAGVCGGDGAANAGCRIVPIKIAPGHSGSASSYAIAAAALHATSVGARAMNLSFAGEQPSRIERLALQWAITHGCVVVAASGNHGYSSSRAREWPASFAADGLCVQVGASDESDRRTVWSGYGPDMDLVAPGQRIWTTFMTYPSAAGVSYPGYLAISGTSFAAPFVTGTVGLLAAARPELADVDFRHVLRESAHDIGLAGVDSTTGWGRLDAAAALDAVAPRMGLWHDEAAGTAFHPNGLGTLHVGEGGFGTLGHWCGIHAAERIEVTAVVMLPDSFLGPVRAWPRVGGTTAVRGDWTLPWFLPWAEVVEWVRPGTALPADARAFTLRGYVYRLDPSDCPECGGDDYVPLPPDQIRFGFSVLGPVDRAPTVTLLRPATGDTLLPGDTLTVRWTATDPDEVTTIEVDLLQPGRPALALARVAGTEESAACTVPCAARVGPATVRVTARDDHGTQTDQAVGENLVRIAAGPCNGPVATLRAAPNPFRAAIRFSGPAAGRVTVFDLSGRRRCQATLDPGGGFVWDGRDETGAGVPPGIYFARLAGAGRPVRLVRIE